MLLNDPWHIAALKCGQSYTYELDVLTDWAVYTPAGRITPVEGIAVRKLRENRDQILEGVRRRSPIERGDDGSDSGWSSS